MWDDEFDDTEDPKLVPIEKMDEMIFPFVKTNPQVFFWYSTVYIQVDDPEIVKENKQKAITHFLQTKLN